MDHLENHNSTLLLSRNAGLKFGLEPLKVDINQSVIEEHLQNLATENDLSSEQKIAGLIKVITCIDLTTLSGDDTSDKVKKLCTKARQPIKREILEALGNDLNITVAAVCVYHVFINTALEALRGTDIPVATVSAGFPAGLSPFKLRVEEIKASVVEGAKEIDAVIARHNVLTGNWQALYDEVSAFREVCGEAHLKVILVTGDLGTLSNIYKASMVAMMAGADFVKTSTGKESVNATLPVGLVMARAIKDYYNYTNYKVGLKPAGGIRTAKEALNWLILVKEELGEQWLTPTFFRFGASNLLDDIENELGHVDTKKTSLTK